MAVALSDVPLSGRLLPRRGRLLYPGWASTRVTLAVGLSVSGERFERRERRVLVYPDVEGFEVVPVPADLAVRLIAYGERLRSRCRVYRVPGALVSVDCGGLEISVSRDPDYPFDFAAIVEDEAPRLQAVPAVPAEGVVDLGRGGYAVYLRGVRRVGDAEPVLEELDELLPPRPATRLARASVAAVSPWRPGVYRVPVAPPGRRMSAGVYPSFPRADAVGAVESVEPAAIATVKVAPRVLGVGVAAGEPVVVPFQLLAAAAAVAGTEAEEGSLVVKADDFASVGAEELVEKLVEGPPQRDVYVTAGSADLYVTPWPPDMYIPASVAAAAIPYLEIHGGIWMLSTSTWRDAERLLTALHRLVELLFLATEGAGGGE